MHKIKGRGRSKSMSNGSCASQNYGTGELASLGRWIALTVIGFSS